MTAHRPSTDIPTPRGKSLSQPRCHRNEIDRHREIRLPEAGARLVRSRSLPRPILQTPLLLSSLSVFHRTFSLFASRSAQFRLTATTSSQPPRQKTLRWIAANRIPLHASICLRFDLRTLAFGNWTPGNFQSHGYRFWKSFLRLESASRRAENREEDAR